MKFNSKDKHAKFKQYINRTGTGNARRFSRAIPSTAVAQMEHKPYGGIYENTSKREGNGSGDTSATD